MYDFDLITVEEVLNLLKQSYPEMALDIEAFYPSLFKEEDVKNATLIEALEDYDTTLVQSDYRINIVAEMFYEELLAKVREVDPTAQWILIGDSVIDTHYPKEMKRWVLYDLEERKAQFATLGYEKVVNIYYTYQANHKTDGIMITQLQIVKE